MRSRLKSAASAARKLLTGALSRLVKVGMDVAEFRLFVLIYFVEGLFLTFTGEVLAARVTEVWGFDKVPGLHVLGSFAAIPWTLKLVIAPFVDWGRRIRLFGNHYRGWSLFGALVMSSALCVLPFMEGMGMTLVVVGVGSLGVALLDVSVDGFAVTSIVSKDRSRVQAVMNLGMYVGLILGLTPLLYGFKFPWTETCFALAAIVLLIVGIAVCMKRGMSMVNEDLVGFSWKALPHLVLNPEKRLLMFFALFTVGAAGATGLLAVPWMMGALKFEWPLVAKLIIGSKLLSIFGGFVAKGWSERSPIRACFWAVVLSACSYAVLGVSWFWGNSEFMYILIVFTGIADGAILVAALTFFMAVAQESRQNVATEYATYSVGVNISRGYAPLLGGWFFAIFGGYGGLFFSAGVLQLLALIPLALLWRRTQRSHNINR